MCSVDANKKSFPPFTIEEARDTLCQISELAPRTAKNNLHLWGGEPFFDRDLLFGIAHEADKLGFKSIQIDTNGFWGKDEAEARAILANLHEYAPSAKFALLISCDNFHQSQEILSPDFLANLIVTAKEEFPNIQIALNSLLLNDFKSVRSLEGSISSHHSGKASAAFDDCYGEFGFYYTQISQDRSRDIQVIPLTVSPVSLSGRCTTGLSPQFGGNPLRPENISSKSSPIECHLSIGVDRQMYMHLLFTSPKVLPMGNIHQFDLGDLIERTETDPIAVSLMRHGYSEIHPHLSEIFDFDLWIKQFYNSCDILQGLEADMPVPIL
jgi:hypothetical protein